MNHLLLDHPFIISLLIFIVVMLVKVFLSIFFIREPMHLFRFFCTQLAKKVNNQNSHFFETCNEADATEKFYLDIIEVKKSEFNL